MDLKGSRGAWPVRHSFDTSVGEAYFLEWGEVDDDADIAVLLHGFPQGADSWKATAELLHNRGLRVLAIEQRGYGPVVHSRRIRDYRLTELVGDVLAVLEARSSASTVHLVGHDWGGAVAWVAAALYPSRFASITVFSMPNPKVLPLALLSTRQIFKSWYVNVFLVPGVVEVVASSERGKVLLVDWLSKTGLNARTSKCYVDNMLERPGGLTAALAWYRASILSLPLLVAMPKVATSTWLVWGEEDVAVDGRAARLTRLSVSGPYRFVQLDGVSHWIPEDAPATASSLVLSHIAATGEDHAANRPL